MRPLRRGDPPTEVDHTTQERREVTFKDYQYARPHLLDRLGPYCCFCETQLSGPLPVEHIVAKSTRPDLRTAWSNLLLVCTNCNSTKGTLVGQPEERERYLWPDVHRTFDTFSYRPEGRVRVRSSCPPELRERAQETLNLCGLQVEPGSGLSKDQRDQLTDRRYQRRSEAWRTAQRDRGRIVRNSNPEFKESVVEKACSSGFFSIWLTIFADDPDMVDRLIAAFPGTDAGRLKPLPQAP